MFDPRIGTVLRRAARLLGRLGPETTDAALLVRLTRDRDPAAFAELVTRHGPAVWALCRRLTRSEPDAEDVFQATFLVLARDPGRVNKAASIGSWLYGVASRIGRKSRVKSGRTLDPHRLLPRSLSPDLAADLSWNEVRGALDEELVRLPDALRAPILLCYFEGKTQDEAAAELGWSVRTVKARVSRGRDVLRTRLTRRGIELPTALAVPLLSGGVASAVPPRLLAGLSAVALTRGQSPGPEVSPAAVALARTEYPTMSSLRVAILAITAAGLLTVGSLIGRPIDLAAPPAPHASSADAPLEADPAFPPGAVRIGSAHFRHVGWHSRVFLADGGNTLVVASEGPTVRFWDVETGKQVHEITLKGGYMDAAFASDGDLLAVAGWHLPNGENGNGEHVLWLIDTAARKLVGTVGSPVPTGGNHQKVRVSADGKRVFVEYEGDVRVIDGKTGDELMRHKGRINAGTLAVSRDGRAVAFGRHDVFLWNWETGEEPKRFAAIGGFGTELMQFAPDGKTLYIVPGGSGGLVTTWDVTTGRQTGSRPLRTLMNNLAFSPDGKTLAVPSHPSSSKPPVGGHAIDLVDATTWKEVGRLPLGHAGVAHVSWSKDSTRLAGVTDYRAWVWDVKTGKFLGPNSPGHEGLITGFAFAPDGRVFTSSDDHTIRSWDAATGKPGLELIHDYWVRDLALSPDGSLVAGSSLRNDLRVWDAKTGAARFKLLGNGSMGGKRVVRFTPDGRRLVAWGHDQYLRMFDTRNGKLQAEHSTRPGGKPLDEFDEYTVRNEMMMLGSADISSDGSTFVIGSWDKSVRVIDVMTGRERTKFEGDPNGVLAVALSPDGKRAAIGGRGKSIETRLPGGRTRHSVANDHRVAVWDLTAKKTIWETTSPGSSARDLRFAPDGTRLAQMVFDEEKKSAVRVWDSVTGKELGRIEFPSRGHHFAFDRTGKRLAVSHWDTTATIFDLETALKPIAPK